MGAIANASEIVSGRTSCRALMPDLWSPHGLEYLRSRYIYGVGALGIDTQDPLLQVYDKVWKAQKRCLREILDTFSAAGIDLLVYKGAEVNERHGSAVAYTVRGDVDVIVRPEQLEQAKQLLRDIGYQQAKFDTASGTLVPIDPRVLAEADRDHYVALSFAKVESFDGADASAHGVRTAHPFHMIGDRVVAVLAIDIATGIDRTMDAAWLFASSIPSVHPGARAMKVEDHLWYLATMFYVQTFQYRHKHKLSQLVDLSLLLSHAKNVDWDYVVATALRLELLPGIYYPLAFLSAISETARVPEPVLRRLTPDHGARLRDYGWQIHKLFGIVEPLPQLL